MEWPSPSLPFLYPPSAFVAAMSVVAVVPLVSLGVAELRGEHVPYSKFLHVVAPQQRAGGGGGKLLPSRAGMLVGYVPALAAVLASFAVTGAADGGARPQLLRAAVAVHFLKRVLEVLFVHRYSGSMPLATVLHIASSYLFYSIMMIYAQYISHDLPEPPVNTLYPGLAVFVIGVAGNFYHHYLLSSLRATGGVGGDKGYKIPRGGLFELVTCPHYLFEIITFFGFAMIGQTVFTFALAVGIMSFLVGRSCATRKWYVSKFEKFPVRIKALVPYVL